MYTQLSFDPIHQGLPTGSHGPVKKAMYDVGIYITNRRQYKAPFVHSGMRHHQIWIIHHDRILQNDIKLRISALSAGHLLSGRYHTQWI